MDIEFANASTLDTNNTGWFIGFSEWAKSKLTNDIDLRFMPKEAMARTIHVKWMNHPAGDRRGTEKPPSEGRTISILVSEQGRFRIEFSPDGDFRNERAIRYKLEKHGDFVIWGEGIHHRWFVDEACTILTIRWIPVAIA